MNIEKELVIWRNERGNDFDSLRYIEELVENVSIAIQEGDDLETFIQEYQEQFEVTDIKRAIKLVQKYDYKVEY